MRDIESGKFALVITRKIDATADRVLHRMTERNISWLRLNTESFGDVEIALRFPNVRDSILTIGDTRTPIGNIQGVWLRRISKPKALLVHEPEARAFAESEADFTLRWLIDLLSNYCPVLDNEINVLKGRNKFGQLAMAEAFGFRIPDTLITNNPMAARDFAKQYKTVALKSIAGYGQQVDRGFYTVYTNIVTKEILDQFESIRTAPVCLQEYVSKKFELRVTVVGQRAFGCRIDSQDTARTEVDWRHYDHSTPHSIYATSQEFDNRLIAAMKYYGIRFASFDLVVTPDDQIVLLEMNPAPQFLWIEDLTGMPITDALIDEILAPQQEVR